MIVTVGEASPKQAQGHIRPRYVKWKHFLSDVSDVVDQTGTVRGRIERAKMSLKPGFHMIETVIVSICRQLIVDTPPMCRSRLPTVMIIWKPGLKQNRDRHLKLLTQTYQRIFYLASNLHLLQPLDFEVFITVCNRSSH